MTTKNIEKMLDDCIVKVKFLSNDLAKIKSSLEGDLNNKEKSQRRG